MAQSNHMKVSLYSMMTVVVYVLDTLHVSR